MMRRLPLLALIATAVLMLSGCGERKRLEERVAQLEAENSDLQVRLTVENEAAAELGLAVDEVMSELDRMTRDEIEILGALGDSEFGQPASASRDLETIRAQLGSLDQKLERQAEIEERIVELEGRVASLTAAGEAGARREAILAERIENLRASLEQRTLVAENLRTLLAAKEAEILALGEELAVERGRREDLAEELADVTTELSDVRETFVQGYVLGATKSELAQLRKSQLLKRRWWVYLPGPNVRSGIGSEPGFTPVDAEANRIALGEGIRAAEVVSAHGKQPALYGLEVGEESWIEVSDPQAFWDISRYLVVRLKR